MLWSPQMKEQVQVFQDNLEEFARKHKRDINKNPEFRKHFHEMCTSIGVDPLQCSYRCVYVYACVCLHTIGCIGILVRVCVRACLHLNKSHSVDHV
jgi:EAP30/Vps36 family